MNYLLHEPVVLACNKYASKNALDEEGEYTSYKILQSESNKWANFLQKIISSNEEQSYVGIISPVYSKSIIAVMGVLKAGLIYVPLDYKSPLDRIKKIIEDAKIQTLIIDEPFFKEHADFFEQKKRDTKNALELKNIILLSQNKKVVNKHISFFSLKDISKCKSTFPLKRSVVSEDLAYILYTSGSTGIPKGVMLTHQNARTFVDWMIKEFKINAKDKIISRAPFQFDLSVFDIFATLSTGATIIIKNPHKETVDKHKEFVSLIRNKKVTVIYTTPSTYISFMNKGGLDKEIPSIRLILYAGEPFPAAFIKKLMKILPRAKFANIYGPTETNIVTCYWIKKIKSDNENIPIGKAVDDTDIKIVNDEGKVCAVGELGEIWVRGGTVTKGYLGNKEKTDQVFVQSPFHLYPTKYWRTGDYGLLLKNGNIEYHGRKDNMIKTRAFRVELGEVETAIASFNSIEEFSVIPFPHPLYQNTLCVFLSIKNFFHLDLFKKHLKKVLPDYMIPYEYVILKDLPKTSSGKVDREKLKKSEYKRMRL